MECVELEFDEKKLGRVAIAVSATRSKLRFTGERVGRRYICKPEILFKTVTR